MQRWPDGSPRIPLARCPHCGKRLDAAGQLEDELPPLPKPHDLTVCFGCGEALTFDHRLRLRKITATELAALKEREAASLRETQETVRAFLRR